MKKNILFALVVSLVAFVSASVFAQQAEDNSFDTGHSSQLVEVADNLELYSATMTVNSVGGSAKTISEQDYVWNLQPGDVLVLKMNLPENSFNVKALVEYRLENNTAVGNIRFNGKNYSDDTVALKMTESSQPGKFNKEIPLNDVRENNELRVFSINGTIGIYNIQIVYDYRMPSSTDNGVTVVLTTPVSTDVLQENLRFEWKTQGPCEKGWVTLQYLDGKTWKTVPGAEFIDCESAQKGKTLFGEFVWKAHGLKAIPKVKITYHDYNTENVLPATIPSQKWNVLFSKLDDNHFLKTIKVFNEYEKQKLGSIKLTQTQISKFISTKRTWTEFGINVLEYMKYVPGGDISYWIIEGDLYIFGGSNIEEQKIALIVKRYIEDMSMQYNLFDKKTIAKELRLFKTVIDQTQILKTCIENRLKKIKDIESKRFFEGYVKQIQNLNHNARIKHCQYISYSVVSPYLATIDRYIFWNKANEAESVSSILTTILKENSISNIELYLYLDVKEQYQEINKKLKDIRTYSWYHYFGDWFKDSTMEERVKEEIEKWDKLQKFENQEIKNKLKK